MKAKCRCVFCGDTDVGNKGRIFVKSERKYGRDVAFWGVCSDCLAQCVKSIAEEAAK